MSTAGSEAKGFRPPDAKCPFQARCASKAGTRISAKMLLDVLFSVGVNLPRMNR